MKRIFFVIQLTFTTTLLGCSNKYLDISPTSSYTVDGFFNSEKDFDQAVTGAYDGLQIVETSTYSQLMNEKRSDNHWSLDVTSSYDDNQVQNFSVSSSTSFLEDAWANGYNVINRCNTILEKLDESKINENKKKNYEGELKFIRSLMYFDLVRYFGKIPIVNEIISSREALEIERSDIDKVYDFIVKDLEDAIEILPDEYPLRTDIGRVTKYAAEGLLGRVYLTMSGYPLKINKFEEAKELFKNIINSNKFQFLPTYDEEFDVANDNGLQFVFSVQFKGGVEGEGNPVPSRNADNDIDPAIFKFGGDPNNIKVSQDLIDSYEPNDLRMIHDIRLEWQDKSGNIRTNRPTPKKFASGTPIDAKGDWDINWPLIRYTDVLMMYAECLNEINYEGNGEALSILNQVRNRAGLGSFNSSDLPNQDAFRIALQNERRHEFVFENLRWPDLVRTDMALSIMKEFLTNWGLQSNFKGREQYIYPLPLRELEVNPGLGPQNTGY